MAHYRWSILWNYLEEHNPTECIQEIPRVFCRVRDTEGNKSNTTFMPKAQRASRKREWEDSESQRTGRIVVSRRKDGETVRARGLQWAGVRDGETLRARGLQWAGRRVERLWEPEDSEDCCEEVSSGHDRDVAPMNSWQNSCLHKTTAVNIPAWATFQLRCYR